MTSINATNSPPSPSRPSEHNKKAIGETGTGRNVTATDGIKKISVNSHDSTENTALSDRTIARAEDYQAIIDRRNQLSAIKELIEQTPAFNKPESGKTSTSLLLVASSYVTAAIYSIKNTMNEKLYAPHYFTYSRDMTLPKDATPYGAKIHLENAFKKIEEMKSLNTQLEAYPSIDIALSLATLENRETLQPHIEALFTTLQNKSEK